MRRILALVLFVAGLAVGGQAWAASALLRMDGAPRNSLFMDFTAGNETLPPWLASSGGANRTRTNSAGILVPMTTPRFDYTGGVAQGVFDEEARTNLLLQSNTLATTPWSTGGNATTTNNATTSPDGNVNATSITPTAQYGGPSQTVAVSASTAYEASCYLKAGTGNTSISLTVNDSGGTNDIHTFTLTTTWQRYSYVHTTAAGITGVGFAVQDRNTSGFGTFYASYCQFGAGSVVTSVTIPTTTATVTGGADVFQFQNQGPAFLQGAAGSFVIETNAVQSLVNARLVGVDGNHAAYVSTVTTAALYNGGGTLTTPAGSGTYSGTIKTGVGFSTTSESLVLGGGTVATAASPWPNTTVTTAYLGEGGGAFWLNAYIRKIALYNYRLPDAMLQAKTVSGAPLP